MVDMKVAESEAVRSALDYVYTMTENLSKPEFVMVVVRWLQDKGVAPEEIFGFDSNPEYDMVSLNDFDDSTKRVFDALLGGEPIRAIYTTEEPASEDTFNVDDKFLESVKQRVAELDDTYLK